MEENKKVNVSTILLEISIIIIIIMGMCLYLLYNTKSMKNEEIKEKNELVVSDDYLFNNNAFPDFKNYIGTWEDEYDGSKIIIKSIDNNRILFDIEIVRIYDFENLVGEIKSDGLVIFNTNNTDVGEFWKGVYGTLTFEEDKVTLEITDSECEYIDEGFKIEGTNY